MDAGAIISVSAAVVALAQLLKGLGISSRFSPLVALLLSAFGVGIWGYSAVGTFTRPQAFSYFVAWITVATAAKGIFETSRAIANGIRPSNGKETPPGDGAPPTEKGA